MENFIVSARKYRPATFKSVVGQASITTTLKNAINTNHLAQAYLFCGPRGVGKTTCARIFAKTINCFNLGEDVEPCNECESCKAFNDNRSYNIHELDAASNNSVEDIRNLIEQVRIPPQVGKYSIYIIDEVHMLSQQAFNAFLKTLEEPPKHAIFILATTEKHKIIPTILSRCQIFDFNRIRVDDAVDYLKHIAESEKISYEEDALNVIAQKADGAMRDALSIFDQVVSFSGGNIQYQKVLDNLNVLDYEYFFSITDAFLESDMSKILLVFNEILDKGFDGHQFINGLSTHFRDLLVCKDTQTLDLLEVGATIKERYKEQTEKCPVDFLLKALKISNAADVSYRTSRNKRLHIELALISIGNIIAEKKKNNNDSIETNSKAADKEPKEPTKSLDNPQEKEEEPKDNPEKKLINRKSKNPVTHPGRRPGSVSIKALTQKQGVNPKEPKEEEGEIENAGSEKNEFAVEDLLQTWSLFAEKFTSRPRIFNLLENHKPTVDNDFVLHLELENVLQEEILNEVRHELIAHLRASLKNDYIQLEVEIRVLEEDEGKDAKRLYTDQEKLKYLMEKNPNLDKLKQTFNLDLDN